jgi:hypothetical protein
VRGARMFGMMIAMAFILTPTALYAGVYGSGERHGMSAIADQRLAGGLMFSLDILTVIGVLSYFFWKAAADYDREERAKAEQAAQERAAAGAT